MLSLIGRERIPVVPVASQEEARSTRKVRGTPGSFHHSKSPPDVSVLSRGTCLPCTASTFTRRTDSHDGGTWDSPVGKPRGKASWESLVGNPRVKASSESHRSLDPRGGKRGTAATAREESAHACPHSRRGLTPLGRLQKYPKIHVRTRKEFSVSDTDSTQGLRPWHRWERNPERTPSKSPVDAPTRDED